MTLRESITAALPDKPFLALEEVAEILDVSPTTVMNWINRGHLRAIRIGTKLVRIPRAEFERFLVEAEITPTEEADPE